MQHENDAIYAEWKRAQVGAALADPACLAPLQRTPAGARRRMDLALRRGSASVRVGLHQPGSPEIVDLQTCFVLHPRLFGLVAPLRPLLNRLGGLRAAGRLFGNLLETGPDLLLRTDRPLTSGDRSLLAGFAAAHGVTRIAWGPLAESRPGNTETVAILAPSQARFGGILVEPPPGSFLQASAEGEAAIVAGVLAGLPEPMPARARIVELFAGCGTITLPLAGSTRVLAVEADAAAAASLRRAAPPGRVEVLVRDLVRQPMRIKELAGAAAIVLDPPYAGAAAQMPAIAASGVARVIYVSCNPAMLARDAAVLTRAGYRLLSAVPIDQFLWSAQVECVAVFGT